MTRFITIDEVNRLRKADKGSFQQKLYQALRARTDRNTRHPGFVQPGDTQEWWHLCWERAADAAFVWHMERNQALGEWLRKAAFWMRDVDDIEWLGPWYRNHQRPLVGQLETTHVSMAMCLILDLCDELFSEDEKASLREALRIKGMAPCLRYCEQMQQEHQHIANWYNVIVSGFGICALTLDDQKAIGTLMLLLRDAYSLYNADSYGESVQYSNYATLALSYVNELILRLHPELSAQVNLQCYANLMDWYASSFLYMKPWADEGEYPRTLNFSDSAAIFRPSGDVLTQVAVRLKNSQPRQAALASWLLETTYAQPEFGPDELATLGMINQFSYSTVLMQPDMAPAKTPLEAGLCEKQSFEDGQIILRDSWQNPRAVLGVQAGYQPLNASGHRHEDLGSFQFVQGHERMIVDGGHCCYRLNAYRYSCSSSQHATIDFIQEVPYAGFGMPANPYEGIAGQKHVGGSIWSRQAPLARNIMNRYVGSAHVLSMDLTDAYESQAVSMAQRAIVSVLPHAVLIIDRAETKTPLKMRTHFPMNNRDGALKTHRADEQRFVFRRRGEAMKIFECEAWVDGEKQSSSMQYDWGYCHRNYHPLANQEGQGREGSAEIYNWVDARPGKTHLRVCAIASDVNQRITGWHIKPDDAGNWYIESPEREKLLVIKVQPDRVYLMQGDEATLLL